VGRAPLVRTSMSDDMSDGDDFGGGRGSPRSRGTPVANRSSGRLPPKRKAGAGGDDGDARSRRRRGRDAPAGRHRDGGEALAAAVRFLDATDAQARGGDDGARHLELEPLAKLCYALSHRSARGAPPFPPRAPATRPLSPGDDERALARRAVAVATAALLAVAAADGPAFGDDDAAGNARGATTTRAAAAAAKDKGDAAPPADDPCPGRRAGHRAQLACAAALELALLHVEADARDPAAPGAVAALDALGALCGSGAVSDAARQLAAPAAEPRGRDDDVAPFEDILVTTLKAAAARAGDRLPAARPRAAAARGPPADALHALACAELSRVEGPRRLLAAAAEGLRAAGGRAIDEDGAADGDGPARARAVLCCAETNHWFGWSSPNLRIL